MGILNLEHLEPGMTLREDVADVNGRVLLRAGAVISEKHLRIFATWGVTEAHVTAGSEEKPRSDATSGPESESLTEAKKYTRSLFRHTDRGHPVIQELMRLCILRKTQQSETQKGAGR